jgi:hypothetical protein
MYKFLALTYDQPRGTRGISDEQCARVCQECKECKSDRSQPWGWSDCWQKCDECNRCSAAAHNADSYNDPYYYRPDWAQRTLATTPALSKQFCDNICGVNMCKVYRERLDRYDECKRQERLSATRNGDCERKWGCPNPNGAEFGYRAPIDPMFTDCKPCWTTFI